MKAKTEKFEYGITKDLEATIYPLSIAGETDTIDVIFDFVRKFYGVENVTDAVFLKDIGVEFKTNLNKIFALIFRNQEVDLDEITNEQLETLINFIYSMNFERISKNLKSLFEKIQNQVKTESPLKGQ